MKGVDIIIICDANNYDALKDTYNSEHIIEKPEFIDWLSYYANASYIITDSFHGTCFSIIMEKRYVSFKAGSTQRFDSLANMLGFSDSRAISIYNDINDVSLDHEVFVEMDYDVINDKISELRVKCLEWLHTALEQPTEENDEDKQMLIDYVQLLKEYYQVSKELKKDK